MLIVFLTDSVLACSMSSANGVLLEYVVPSESLFVLNALRERSIRVGIIVNHGGHAQDSVERALRKGGLLDSVDSALTVYANGYTPQALAEAVAKTGPIPQRNLFVGEHCDERARALRAGFAAAAPHPLLALEVINGEALTYARVSGLASRNSSGWLELLLENPIVPLHLTREGDGTAYVITSPRVAALLAAAGLEVKTFGARHDPQVKDVYLVHDDRAVPEGTTREEYAATFLAGLGQARFILGHADGATLLALPPDVSIEEIHFPNALHGHNRRLLPSTSLLPLLTAAEPAILTRPRASLASNQTLSLDEVKALQEGIIQKTLERLHLPYIGKADLDASGHRVTTRHFASSDNKLVTAALSRHLHEIGGGLITVRHHDFTLQGVPLHNIEADLAGSTPGSYVLISAHFDSTAKKSGVFDPAPGADDDASGVAAVLAAAEVAVKLRASGQLRHTLRFVLFNAEEEYVYGSQRYAECQKENGVNIIAVFQMDMIGYSGGSPQREFEVHVGCLQNLQAESASRGLADTIGRAASQVSPGLNSPQIYPYIPGGRDDLDGRSDHTPFLLKGYSACLVTEDWTEGPLLTSPPPRVNGDYHKSSDVKIDYSYAAEIARAVAGAAILTAKS